MNTLHFFTQPHTENPILTKSGLQVLSRKTKKDKRAEGRGGQCKYRG
jgi:hypothetical protein